MTKRFFLGLFLALGLLSGAYAAGGGVALDKFPAERVTNLPALQNGARLFVNYCLNCHSASYMRYNRMRDIGSPTFLAANIRLFLICSSLSPMSRMRL
jgi:ubiquinol-cytochrome c reductase cytochrome c1 subunit